MDANVDPRADLRFLVGNPVLIGHGGAQAVRDDRDLLVALVLQPFRRDLKALDRVGVLGNVVTDFCAAGEYYLLRMMYNAFISYSHAADGKLAPALQAGLQRFAKPWYRLRALHIFRDQTNLSLNPSLWSSIQAALDQSDWFIVLASPEAAASKWVDREIEYWLKGRPVERILMVLTEGTMKWDASQRAFDARTSSAVPPRLMHAFADELLYLDLVWAHDLTDLSLSHPRFRDAVAEIAGAVSGRPKDELIGEDVRQHLRTRRLTWSAIAALSVLTLSSVVAAWIAVHQQNIGVLSASLHDLFHF